MSVIPGGKGLRQEGKEFKNSLVKKARPFLKTNIQVNNVDI